jgi:hypothetical protein
MRGTFNVTGIIDSKSVSRGGVLVDSSASASASGINLDIVLSNVFKSLINALINSINPNLNLNEKGYVYTTIEATINLVVTFFDSNNNQTIVPIVFTTNTNSLLSVGNKNVNTINVTGNLSSTSASIKGPAPVSATSASIKGTLGQLNGLLDQEIPTISNNVTSMLVS